MATVPSTSSVTTATTVSAAQLAEDAAAAANIAARTAPVSTGQSFNIPSNVPVFTTGGSTGAIDYGAERSYIMANYGYDPLGQLSPSATALPGSANYALSQSYYTAHPDTAFTTLNTEYVAQHGLSLSGAGAYQQPTYSAPQTYDTSSAAGIAAMLAARSGGGTPQATTTSLMDIARTEGYKGSSLTTSGIDVSAPIDKAALAQGPALTLPASALTGGGTLSLIGPGIGAMNTDIRSNVKVAVDPLTGEISEYTLDPWGNFGLIGGAGRYAAQSGEFSIKTPTGYTLNLETISPFFTENLSKAAATGANIPWHIPAESSALMTMGPTGITGSIAIPSSTTLQAATKGIDFSQGTFVPATGTLTGGGGFGALAADNFPGVSLGMVTLGGGTPTAGKAAAATPSTLTLVPSAQDLFFSNLNIPIVSGAAVATSDFLFGGRTTVTPSTTTETLSLPTPFVSGAPKGYTPGTLAYSLTTTTETPTKVPTVLDNLNTYIQSYLPSPEAGEKATILGTAVLPTFLPFTLPSAINILTGKSSGSQDVSRVINPFAGQYTQFYEQPLLAPASYAIGAGLGAAYEGLTAATNLARGAVAEKVISEGGVWRSAINSFDFITSNAPKVLGGLYAADVAGRATDWGTKITPESVSTARGIVTQETAPLIAGTTLPSTVISAARLSNINYAAALQEGTTTGRLEYYVTQPITSPIERLNINYQSFIQEGKGTGILDYLSYNTKLTAAEVTGRISTGLERLRNPAAFDLSQPTAGETPSAPKPSTTPYTPPSAGSRITTRTVGGRVTSGLAREPSLQSLGIEPSRPVSGETVSTRTIGRSIDFRNMPRTEEKPYTRLSGLSQGQGIISELLPQVEGYPETTMAKPPTVSTVQVLQPALLDLGTITQGFAPSLQEQQQLTEQQQQLRGGEIGVTTPSLIGTSRETLPLVASSGLSSSYEVANTALQSLITGTESKTAQKTAPQSAVMQALGISLGTSLIPSTEQITGVTPIEETTNLPTTATIQFPWTTTIPATTTTQLPRTTTVPVNTDIVGPTTPITGGVPFLFPRNVPQGGGLFPDRLRRGMSKFTLKFLVGEGISGVLGFEQPQSNVTRITRTAQYRPPTYRVRAMPGLTSMPSMRSTKPQKQSKQKNVRQPFRFII